MNGLMILLVIVAGIIILGLLTKLLFGSSGTVECNPNASTQKKTDQNKQHKETIPPETKDIQTSSTETNEIVSENIDKISEDFQINYNKEENTIASEPPIIYSPIKLPFKKNLNFSGREYQLNQLRMLLAMNQVVKIVGNTNNSSGIGKTQLALEYAYKSKEDYEIIWWIRAENAVTASCDFSELAKPLGLNLPGNLDVSSVCEAVVSKLSQKENWLIIFDDVVEINDIIQYIPNASKGHVLVILRNFMPVESRDSLSIGPFERSEAANFVVQVTRKNDVVQSHQLAEKFADLPLSCSIAAKTIRVLDKSIPDYLYIIRQRQLEPALKRVPSDEYPATLALAWDIAMDYLDHKSAANGELLKLCAYFASEDIPLDLLRNGLTNITSSVITKLSDSARYDEILNILERFSLIERSDDSISMHRAIQAITRDKIEYEQQKLWATVAVEIIDAVFSYESDEEGDFIACCRLIPHALAAASYAEKLGAAPEVCARILNEAGTYLKVRGDLNDAKIAIEKAIMIADPHLGSSHPWVAVYLNNLASVLKEMGDLKTSRKLYERSINIDKNAYGLKHPNVATRLGNLGVVLMDMGDMDAALECSKEALEITETTFGTDHPNVAQKVAHLGYVYERMGNTKEAKYLYERALAITEQAYGPRHPDVAMRISQLGEMLVDVGDLMAAQLHLQKAVRIAESMYGQDHINVVDRISKLGWVLEELGDTEGAKDCYERALNIVKAVYGDNHPEVASRANDYGYILAETGDLEHSKLMYEWALRIDETAYGPTHSKVGIRLNSLAGILEEMGEITQATLYYAKAYSIFKETLGNDHPFTIVTNKNLEAITEQKSKPTEM